MSPYNNLDDSEKTLVDNILSYDIIAEECAAYIRQHDEALLGPLWEEQMAIFSGDPITYPTILVSAHDPEGRKKFREKCQALFFPVGSERPLKDYIMMYFAAAVGMQLAYKEADEHPHRNDLCRIANLRSCQIHRNQVDQDLADKLDYNVDEACQDRPNPLELLDKTIHCRDKSSSNIIEYVVVDYLNSVMGGDYFMLEDQHGRRETVTPEELEEICVDYLDHVTCYKYKL